MCEIENRMAVNPAWRQDRQSELTEALNGPGCTEIGIGIFVPEEDAFQYALEQCFEEIPSGVRSFKWTEEFRTMLVEWFYSGNWIKEDQGYGRI